MIANHSDKIANNQIGLAKTTAETDGASSPATSARPQKSARALGHRDRPGHGAKPAAVRDRAVAALLTAPTVDAAAQAAGIDARTLRRWLADDAFAAEVTAARQIAFDDAINRVRGLADRAVNTVVELLTSAPPSVKLAAAKTLLELGVHQRDAEAILDHLDDLERRHRDRNQPNGHRRWIS